MGIFKRLFKGNSVTISSNGNATIQGNGNRVTINGKRVSFNGKSSESIRVGNNDIMIESVNAQHIAVYVVGNVSGGLSTVSGDIKVQGNVTGSVKTISGDVTAKLISAGSIETVSGDVRVK